MNYIIITGASKGLGKAIAKQLISKDNFIICISRSKNKELINFANSQKAKLNYYKFDLSKINEIQRLMNKIFSNIDIDSISSIILINNAGTLSPIKPIDKARPNEIIYNLNLNLIAPIILTEIFINITKKLNIEKRIINISSGAAIKPYYGWSCYCSSKSGLEMFTKCLAIEQNNSENPVKIISFIPGIMDTDMQTQIRSTTKENFIDLERFIGYKNEGKLSTPDYVASKIIEIINRKEINNGELINIKDLK